MINSQTKRVTDSEKDIKLSERMTDDKNLLSALNKQQSSNEDSNA